MSNDSSAPEYQTSSAPIEPKASGGRRFLHGCLITAAVVIVVALVALFSFVSWLRTSGELMETGSLFDDRTVLYGEVRLRAEDPGVRQFVEEALAAQRAREAEARRELPGPLAGIVEMLQGGNEGPELDRVLPVVVAVLKQGDAFGEASPPLFAISLPKVGNRLRFADMIMSLVARFAGASDFKVDRHGDEALYFFDTHSPSERAGRFWVAIVGSDILISLDEAAVRAGIDRLTGKAAPPSGSPLLAERPEGTILYASVKDGHVGEVIELIGGAIPSFGEVLGRVTGNADALTLFATLVTADSLEGEIRIRGGDAETRDTDHQGSVTALVAGGEVTLIVEPTGPPPGGGRAWRVRVDGIAAAARSGVVSLDDGDGVAIEVE